MSEPIFTLKTKKTSKQINLLLLAMRGGAVIIGLMGVYFYFQNEGDMSLAGYILMGFGALEMVLTYTLFPRLFQNATIERYKFFSDRLEMSTPDNRKVTYRYEDISSVGQGYPTQPDVDRGLTTIILYFTSEAASKVGGKGQLEMEGVLTEDAPVDRIRNLMERRC